MTTIELPVIDCDAHVIEPPDLWTSRLPHRFADEAPHLEFDDAKGVMRWRVGPHRLAAVGQYALAGWREFFPSYPPTLEDADPACYDPVQRLARMDEHGIDVQLLFPNLLGFEIYGFLDLADPELRIACVRAYNDFITEFCSAAPKRLIPQMFLPFWDVEASLTEMKRCADLGHRAVNFAFEFEKIGLPVLRSEHWRPILELAQDLELPITFHIGFASSSEKDFANARSITDMRDFARHTALFMLGNASCIAEVIMSGLCERYPRLKFVSVESGFGYIPYLLESLDWQYLNMGGRNQFRDFLMPSEYFRRQVYATFWFEGNIDRVADLYPDNVMFSSDFPHPTSLSPGPNSCARNAQETIEANLAGLAPELRRKLIHENAAHVYGLG
jgi:predicted TIM-barrel fold metal-dependent hydrolase